MKSKTTRKKPDFSKLALETLAVRAGTRRTAEYQEHSEAMFLTSSFCFDSAELAADGFAHADQGFIYSRFTNPTVSMFQDRLAALEGGEACIATASGMSAILTMAMAHLQAGDHVVCSRSVFGATIQLFTAILGKFGIETTYVDMSDLGSWQAAVKPNTKMFYLETPSNPLTEVADIAGIAKIAKAANALYVVDNCFCTPALQKPIELGADVVIHSATKYLDGQGRVLGGAILGSREYIKTKVMPFARHTGPSMSAFNAWVLLKSLETLTMRVEKMNASAQTIAERLESHPAIKSICYPFLKSHAQHELARRRRGRPATGAAAGAALSVMMTSDEKARIVAAAGGPGRVSAWARRQLLAALDDALPEPPTSMAAPRRRQQR